jgi:hypothetical protein
VTSENFARYWKEVSIIDPDTGEHCQQYYFRRTRARRIPLTSHLARQMAGYALIERDLRMTLQWLNSIAQLSEAPKNRNRYAWTDKEDEAHALTLGLFVAALVFYGKCFSDCEGRRIRLSEEWIPQGFEDSHRLLIAMRNNFAAHSGAERFEAVNVVLVIPEKKDRIRDKPRLYRELRQTEALVSQHDDEFSAIKLVQELHKKVMNKLQELNDKIFRDEINPKGMAYWVKQQRY